MRKSTLIILVITLSLTAKSQHIGITVDAGQSWLSNSTTYDESKRSAGLFYGIGVFFNTQIKKSKLGINSSLDFNKRGYQVFSSKNWEPSSFNPIYHFLSENEDTYSNYALTLSVVPTYKVLEKLKIGLGLHYTYSFGQKLNSVSKYYRTDVNGNNRELLSEYESSYGNSNLSFIDKSYFGIKTFLVYKISGIIDMGLAYQYSRSFKSNPYEKTRFYNILNITTNIYFKKRG